MSRTEYINSFVRRHLSRWGCDPYDNSPAWFTAMTYAEIQIVLASKGFDTGVTP